MTRLRDAMNAAAFRLAPEEAAKANFTEAEEARLFMGELDRLAARRPHIAEYLREVVHVPNEGGGGTAAHRRQGAEKVRQGLKKGYPDFLLDVPRTVERGGKTFTLCGWRGELKRKRGPGPTKEQKEWLSRLEQRGYWANWHRGHRAMLNDLLDYLGES